MTVLSFNVLINECGSLFFFLFRLLVSLYIYSCRSVNSVKNLVVLVPLNSSCNLLPIYDNVK